MSSRPLAHPVFSRRRGAVLVAVLVVLMVASLLLGAMLRVGRQEHQVLRQQLARFQADALALSAIERAAAQLAQNADYQSETWQIAAQDLHSRDDALVEIAVEGVAEQPQRRRILVEVCIPSTGQRRVQHRHTALIDLPDKDTMP